MAAGIRVVHLVDLEHVQPEFGPDVLGQDCAKRYGNCIVSAAIDLDDWNDEIHGCDVLCFDKSVRNSGSRFVVASLGRVVGR